MAGLDEANLRVGGRIDGIGSDAAAVTYTVRLVRTGAYDGPTFWSTQLARYVASRLWLILRRRRAWDVVVEKDSAPVWRARCPDHEAAVRLGVDVAARLRRNGRFTPP